MAAGLVDISVLGDKALQRKLNRLPNAMQKKIVRKAMRKGGKIVLAQTKVNIKALRVTGKHTDRLHKNMKLKSIKRSRSGIGVEVVTPEREKLGIPASAKSFWPVAIELGTSKTPARPYMRDAMDTKRQESLGIIKREIATGIVREAMRR